MSTETKAAQHTPWSLTRTVITHNWPFRAWETTVVDSNSHPVAVAIAENEEESVQRARLIAAAPELLGLLKGILVFRPALHITGSKTHQGNFQNWLNSATEAVAKAEGEKP